MLIREIYVFFKRATLILHFILYYFNFLFFCSKYKSEIDVWIDCPPFTVYTNKRSILISGADTNWTIVQASIIKTTKEMKIRLVKNQKNNYKKLNKRKNNKKNSMNF